MMQTGSRCVFRYVKHLNSSIFNRHIYNCLFRNEVIQNTLHSSNKEIYLKKYFGTNSSALPTNKSVASIEDLKKFISEEKQIYLKLLSNILNSITFEKLSSEDAKLLFVCCGSSVPASTKQARNSICQHIYRKLLQHNKLDLDICHIYIEICTQNGVVIDCKSFLSTIKFIPNQRTYKLLLDNVCEKGDINQSLELLEIMKIQNVPANEDMFNKLVLAHTICGGVKSGEVVLKTMRTAQISESPLTKFALLKGVLQRDVGSEVDYVLQRYPVDISEKQLLELLETLGLSGNISWLAKIKRLYSNVSITKDYIITLTKLCTHLVHMDKAEHAMTIYQEFVDTEKDQNYGFFILKEMLHCDVNIDRIIRLCNHLVCNNLNTTALEKLTELALRHHYTEASWKLLQNMSTLRPHYFWPLLLDASKKDGEIGVFNVLQKMVHMGVEVDSETMVSYVFPFCNTDDLKVLIKKLQNLNVTAKDAINPLLIVLLQNNKVKQAADLCQSYNVNIFDEKVFKLISSSWVKSNDNVSTVFLLQRYCESNYTKNDLVGEFLTEALSSCKKNYDFIQYIKLLELIHKRKLKVSTATADALQDIISSNCKNLETSGRIKNNINTLLDFGLNPEQVHIPHPRDMTVQELECHLLELQEKNMETRGVLRRLIQLYAGLGQSKKVNELREQFLSAGYEESVGMKASLMHNYIKEGHLNEALSVYSEIKTTSPDFQIDEFKLIDLASLLVKQGKCDEAMNMLMTETKSRKVRGGQGLIKNCWKLLGCCENADEQLKMFELLVEKGYCKPSNIIFGPLVRIHLNRGDLEKSVHVYINCAREYRCTPLQLELMREILKAQNQDLLRSVIEATQNIHGQESTQATVMAALAENGQEKPLTKLLVENKVNIKYYLEKRCLRWVEEGKTESLHTLVRACERSPKEVFNINFIYNCIMRTYSLRNDYKGALDFYEQLLEKHVTVDKQLEMQFRKFKNYKCEKSVKVSR